MEPVANDWLDKALGLDGVYAAAICAPDGTARSRATNESPDIPAIEHAVRCAADVFAVLRFQKIPAKWLRLEFDNAHLYCATNHTKHCFGLLVKKADAQPVTSQIEQLLTEFADTARL
ncbi:MAG: hypothetical protein NZ739_06870 [Verrucomicrobiae bacterium]|nr:hypothetical protein [Verrucomicrobiae bacterium]